MSKKKKKSKKKSEYDPVVDFISPDIAIIQASALLDAAATRAIKSGNIKDMAIVSRGWLEVGGILAGLGEAREEAESHDVSSHLEMGYRGPVEDDGVPEEEIAPEEDRVRIIGFRGSNV